MRSNVLLAATFLTALAAPLLAAPSDMIPARINAYRELGAAFKGINDSLRGDTHPVIMQQYARQIVGASRNQYNLFPAGSGPAAGRKTAALASIWTRPAEFRAAQDAFAEQANAFQAAVKSGRVSAIRSQARKLGQTCKNCHHRFREEKD